MGRLYSVLALTAMLLFMPARECAPAAQPVFFSMLFPQLTPGFVPEATAGEAVRL